MDDLTYMVLDECYFLTTKSELLSSLNLRETDLQKILQDSWTMGYLRIYEQPDGFEFGVEHQFDWDDCWFVLSKKGLQEHTST